MEERSTGIQNYTQRQKLSTTWTFFSVRVLMYDFLQKNNKFV